MFDIKDVHFLFSFVNLAYRLGLPIPFNFHIINSYNHYHNYVTQITNKKEPRDGVLFTGRI